MDTLSSVVNSVLSSFWQSSQIGQWVSIIDSTRSVNTLRSFKMGVRCSEFSSFRSHWRKRASTDKFTPSLACLLAQWCTQATVKHNYPNNRVTRRLPFSGVTNSNSSSLPVVAEWVQPLLESSASGGVCGCPLQQPAPRARVCKGPILRKSYPHGQAVGLHMGGDSLPHTHIPIG